MLRNWPGEGARLTGRIVVTRGAGWLTVRGLWLDGRNPGDLPSPTINAPSVAFLRNDVTNRNTGICFVLGNATFGRADHARVRRNRIHHCGRLPPMNHHHGVYVEAATGARITGNWIHANADRGVQLYPDAQHTLVKGNVIAGNGQGLIFSGEDGVSSSDNLVERNVIAASRVRHNVESFYPDGTPPGERNLVRLNCIGGGVEDTGDGGIQGPPEGFVAEANLLVRAAFERPGRGDLRVAGPAECAALLPARGWRVPGPRSRPPPNIR